MFLSDTLKKRHSETQLGQLLSTNIAIPEFGKDFTNIDIIDRNLDAISKFGIRLSGIDGSNNIIFVPENARFYGFRVNMNNRNNVLIFIGNKCNLTNDSLISIEGDGHTIVVGGGGGVTKANITMRSRGGLFHYGDENTANYINCLVHGAVALIIGSKCMFSWGINIRTYDSHALIDIESRKQINSAKNVNIGSHVWVAQGVTVMPGVTIGIGTIVGAGSIVTKSIPPRTLAVGTPARVIREGVTWARESFPTEKQIDTALTEGGA